MTNQANVVQNDIARAIYLVDSNGNPITTANPLGVNATFSASSLAINDPTTTANKATVDGSGNLHVAIAGALAAGTNVIGHVIVDSGSISAANPSVGTDGSAIPASSTLLGASDGTNLQPLQVDGSKNLKVTASSLPLPTGASTSAKQPALGTAGTASSDVLSVQGIASMTALKTDGSGVTQPVSGTFWQTTQPVSGTVTANAGTGNFTVAQATAANLNATATIQAVTGTSLSADQSNSELRVSNYVKTTTAGDTALTLGRTTKSASLPVTMASDQDNINVVVNAALPAGSAVIGSTTIQATSGTALVADQSNTELRTSIYGKATAAGDTPVLLNNDGSVQHDLRKVLGSALAANNPIISENNISNWIRNGQGFSATTGILVTSTNANLLMGASLFNPAAGGKNVLVYSIKFHGNASTATGKMYATTVDPAYANAITPLNSKPGGAASTASVTSAANNATAGISTSGTIQDPLFFSSLGTFEFLTNGAVMLFVSGSANGVSVFANVSTAGNSWGVTFRWIEY